MKVHQKKKKKKEWKAVRHGSPNRFPALWDQANNQNITRGQPFICKQTFASGAPPLFTCQASFAMLSIPSLICLHLGKEERKQSFPLQFPVGYNSKGEGIAGKPPRGKRPLEAAVVGPTPLASGWQLCFARSQRRGPGVPKLARRSGWVWAARCSPPPHPLQRCIFQLFSFPVELTVIESAGLFFPGPPRGPEAAGSFREDIASYPGDAPGSLSAARAFAPRGTRRATLSASARRLRPEGETTRGPNGGLYSLPRFTCGSNRINTKPPTGQ